jgi:hypothetical protein
MLMHFPRDTVEQLIAHAKAAPKHRALHGVRKTQKPGLWLVGDDGVYLLSNGDPALLAFPNDKDEAKRRKQVVAYARECNPLTMQPDKVDDVKVRAFGGDDGLLFIPLTDFEGALATYPEGKDLEMSVTPRGAGVYQMARRSPPAQMKGKAA